MANKTLMTILAAATVSLSPFSSYGESSGNSSSSVGSACSAVITPHNVPHKIVPHYLCNIPTKYEDDVDRLTSKFMVYDSMLGKYPNHPPKNFLNGAVEEVVPIHGQQVKFVFKGYRHEKAVKDQKKEIIAHYTQLGREELSLEEFAAVKNDLTKTQEVASLFAYQKHQHVRDVILSSLENQFRKDKQLKGSEKLADKLKQEVTPGVTVADALYLPDMTLADFVPKMLVFGPIPALGMVYLNSGIIFYDNKARVLDFMDDVPNILVHECEHRNTKLQRMPFAFAFDAETWASLPILETNDAFDFLLHPYYQDVREIATRLFSFDSEYVFKKSFFITEGGIKVDKQRLQLYMRQIKEISKTIQDTALNEFIPEYYAHFSFWSGVNDKLKDKNAAFKIYMYMVYEPTLLDGPENTRKWLEQNKLVIEEAAKEALLNISSNPQATAADKGPSKREMKEALLKLGINTETVSPATLQAVYTRMHSLGYFR